MENKNHFWISNSRQENQKSDYEMGLNPLLINYFIIIIEIVNFRYMEKEFNQKEYIKEYQKENYKQFKTKLKPDEMEEVNDFLHENNMNKREFILKAKDVLERGVYIRKYLVVKIKQYFTKKGDKWTYVDVLDNTKKTKIFSNKNEAEKYYNSVKLNDHVKNFSERYSDFKGLFEYDSSQISDEMIKNNEYELDEFEIIKDESSFKA